MTAEHSSNTKAHCLRFGLLALPVFLAAAAACFGGRVSANASAFCSLRPFLPKANDHTVLEQPADHVSVHEGRGVAEHGFAYELGMIRQSTPKALDQVGR